MTPVCSRIRRAGAGKPTARIVVVVIALACLLLARAGAPAAAKVKSWPPAKGPGQLFVHFGEEHVNDDDGATLLPKVVRQSARYRPRLVTMSGDKADDGEPEQFELWSEVMHIYDSKGIPWFAGVGNHDRKAPPGFPGGVATVADFGPYQEFFADRPYPMGDAPGYGDGIQPRERAATDPDGAASHYFADVGGVRWIFIDNSCWSIIQCDPLQHPSGQDRGGSEPQFDFLERVGGEASDEGKLVFVVMHMPTRDPGDQTYREPTAVQHTMGKTAGGILDNSLFEQAAVAGGVDGVFLGHIKGQFLYKGEGEIPYFIDGGAGGELYTTGPVGTDHGYWHGYRLIRVHGGSFETDSVPIFVAGGIQIAGTGRVQQSEKRTFEAFGHQPVFNDPAKVPALELRDPDPVPRSGAGLAPWVGDLARWLAPLTALAFMLALARLATVAPRRRRVVVPALVTAFGAIGFAGVSTAQQSEPTSTPVESLPNPARIWTSSDPLVLRPVASETDDPRRNPRTQTADGTFRGACPGRSHLTITSGFEHRGARIVVPSGPGPIVRSLPAGAGVVEATERTTVARVGLDQRARVVAKVSRKGRKVASLKRACTGPGNHAIAWNGRSGKRGSGAPADPGTYRVEVWVLSDRKPVRRGFRVRVRG
jgi:Calcineurin-like phosphoesterase